MATGQDKDHTEGPYKVKMSDKMDDPKTPESEDHDTQTGAVTEVHQTQAEPLGLLSLPGEIRNNIYRLALVETDPRRLICHLKPPALALVNKQVFSEALPIYYSENNFYLQLFGSRRGFWDPFHTHRSTRMARFNRFTRMVEYFGRSETLPSDQSPLRHIKNIVVQVTNSRYGSIVYGDLQTLWVANILEYCNICIRGEQQRITYTSDLTTALEPFDPGDYHWTVVDVGKLNKDNTRTVADAYDLLQLSFTGRTQPIERAILFLHGQQQNAIQDRVFRNDFGS